MRYINNAARLLGILFMLSGLGVHAMADTQNSITALSVSGVGGGCDYHQG